MHTPSLASRRHFLRTASTAALGALCLDRAALAAAAAASPKRKILSCEPH